MAPKLCLKIESSDLPLHFPVEWLIRALVLWSMILQVFLVVGGGYRYRSSSPALRFFVWLAYMSADLVATSALSIMTHSAQTQIYGVWAPLLLLHLGGPDTITAYSTADNELWIRHSFILIYQVSVAGYVVYLSSIQGHMLASAILLFIAGATKYGERTLALRYASYSQIVTSTQPVYKFMELEEDIDNENESEEYNYLVMGEEDFYKKVKARGNASQGNHNWNSLLRGRIVTIKNVWDQEGLQATDSYILCLSHALFKMYKRRFVSLFFHEGVRRKTRIFFINDECQPCEKLFKIVEMELKFMYDTLFSKSSGTAFRKTGTIERLINTLLLLVAGTLLYIESNVKLAQKIVTHILISVALAIEVYQLCRIALSDWTMVRLICANIHFLRRPRPCCWFKFKLVQLAISVLGRARKTRGKKYWKESITQYSVLDACSSKWSSIWHWSEHYRMFGDLIVPLFIKAFHMKEKPVDDAFKRFIFQKLKATCSPDQDIEICRSRVYGYDEYLVTMGYDGLQWASELDMEDHILTWHIATSICEKFWHDGHPSVSAANKNIIFSSLLSNYCAYLLVSHPNLLPLHPDIAKVYNIELHYKLATLSKKQQWWYWDYPNDKTILGNGKRLAQELLGKSEDMWEILSGHWAALLIYMAAYNKAPLHAECLACGGEFFSQVWALLGHMGCGEQSDTAVTKKKEEKSKKEKEEEEKKRTREEETSKEFEKNRRTKEGKNARKRERLRAKKEEQLNLRREEDKKQNASERQNRMLQSPYHG